MKKKILLSLIIATCSIVGCGTNNTLESEYEQLQSQYDMLKSDYEQLQAEYNLLIEASNTEDTENLEDSRDFSIPVYNGEYGTLTLTEASPDGLVFILENTTEDTYTIYSDYIKLDDTTYNDDWDNNIGLTYEDIASGNEMEITFVVPIENLNFETISGQFLICDFETGENLGLISFQDIVLN